MEYARLLGDSVRKARSRLGLTQNEVANLADIDCRTVLNIENYKGNPKLEILFPLLRTLKIDAREIFSPETLQDSPALRQLVLLVEDCSESEAEQLIPFLKDLIFLLRSKDTISIE